MPKRSAATYKYHVKRIESHLTAGRVCKEPGCGGGEYSRGFCKKHYEKDRRRRALVRALDLELSGGQDGTG